MKRYFVTGTGTGVGKTLVTAALCHQLTLCGRQIHAVKPVISGFAENDPQSDTVKILQSRAETVSRETIDAISPWRYTAALSPQMAAWKEGNPVTAEQVAAFCRSEENKADNFLVEGAGGILSPLNDRQTFLDVMTLLNYDVLLVCGTYLGTVSHTLSALHVLKTERQRVAGVIVSESAQEEVAFQDAIRSLRVLIDPAVPVVGIPRIAAVKRQWEQVPSLEVVL